MFKKIKPQILFLLVILIATTGFRCTFIKSKKEKEALKPIELNYWRVWDGREALSDILGAYHAIHPNVRINMRRLLYEEFEKELLRSFAKNKGVPDIISIHASWTRKYKTEEFIAPLPKEITMAYQYKKKTMGVKEETIVELKTKPSLSVGQLKEKFVDTVAKDTIIGGKIYGLPLSVDTMAMYYNRDLLNNAGIPVPPTDWEQFQEAVKKLTFFDEKKEIAISGAAIGSANNVRRSTDILALLMMQNGAIMMDDDDNVSFQIIPPTITDRTYHPGVEALRFYIDFSDPTKEVYTWNDTMPDSLLAFARGNVAFFFGYSYDRADIEAISKGKLNYSITNVPQIKGGKEVNVASYWVESVTSKSKNSNEAWDFILFAATNEDQVKKYLEKTKKPTALRSLIEEQGKSDEMRVFSSQLLTAINWYRGNNANTAEDIMKDLINAVRTGEMLEKSIGFAANRVQQTVRSQPIE